MAKRNKQQKRQARRQGGYKQHSKDRYRSVQDWPDQEFEDLKLFNSKANRKKARSQKRSAEYLADIQEIVFQELGGYYWCPAAEPKELNDNTNLETGG